MIPGKSTYTFKKILFALVWMMLGSGVVVLLIAAITKKNNEHCTTIEVTITGVENNYFVDKKEVLAILEKANGGRLETKPVHSIDLAALETALQKSQWIKKAELFFDNNNILRVSITEREPVARIFTTSGLSFYIDTSLARLPLSDKFSPRLPVFSNFPGDAMVFSKQDSSLAEDINMLGKFISADSFWMAQIDQVDILPNGSFDLIPKLGNQVIHFGKVEKYQQKFSNLLCFYKQVAAKKGWSQYASLDAQYAGQIVGVKRGAGEFKTDSLRSVQIMKAIIAEAQKHTNDSTNIQLEQSDDNNNSINKSSEIENTPDENVKENIQQSVIGSGSLTPIHVPEKPTEKAQEAATKIALAAHSSSIEKPNPAPATNKVAKAKVLKPSQSNVAKPKALMPPKSEY